MYNTSQKKCVRYRFRINNSLESAEAEPGDPDLNCDTADYSSYVPMTDASSIAVTGRFAVTTTDVDAKRIGKVTITMKVDGGKGLQTTVSFRDYQGTVQ